MVQDQVADQIKVINEMINKTKKEVAQSGSFFILIGILSAAVTLITGLIEFNGSNNFTLYIVAVFAALSALAGFLIARKEDKNSSVKSYTKTLFWNIWIVCGLAALFIVFILPYFNVIPFRSVPTLVMMLMALGLWLTGVVLELKAFKWISILWIIGILAIAIFNPPFSFFLIALLFVFGWIVPGLLLNRKIKFGKV